MPSSRVLFQKAGVSYEFIRHLNEPEGDPARMLAWRRLADGRADPVVLTQLPAPSDSHHRLRIFEEAMRVRRLSHPVICRLYALVRHGAALYAVTEYVDGVSLEKLLALAAVRRRRLSSAFACHVVSELAGALQQAHKPRTGDWRSTFNAHGVIHARNVRVSRFGKVRLAGLGLEVRQEVQPWELPQPAWSRLEQWAHRASHAIRMWLRRPLKPKAWPMMTAGDSMPAEASSVVFPLGCVLLEMLTGRNPLGDKAARGASPPRLASLSRWQIEWAVPRVPAKLKIILARALGAESTMRYTSGAELRDALLSYMRVWEPPYGEQEVAAELFRIMTGVEGLL